MLVFLLTIFATTAFAQENGTCSCGFFITIAESGLLPPNERTIGPVLILPDESTVEGPCNGNTEAACDLFCDTAMQNYLDAGYDLDTVIEVEVGPDIYENYTVGAWMCQRSYELHPDIPDYNGTPREGSPTQVAISIDAGNCEDWTIRREYPELTICCSDEFQYVPCEDGPGPGK